MNGEQPFDKWEIPGVIKTRKCLRQMITAESSFLLSLYRHYQNGVLPFAGGLLEQPALYCAAMTFIDREAHG